MWIVIIVTMILLYFVMLKQISSLTEMKIKEPLFLKSESFNYSYYYSSNSFLKEFGTLSYNRNIVLLFISRV